MLTLKEPLRLSEEKTTNYQDKLTALRLNSPNLEVIPDLEKLNSNLSLQTQESKNLNQSTDHWNSNSSKLEAAAATSPQPTPQELTHQVFPPQDLTSPPLNTPHLPQQDKEPLMDQLQAKNQAMESQELPPPPALIKAVDQDQLEPPVNPQLQAQLLEPMETMEPAETADKLSPMDQDQELVSQDQVPDTETFQDQEPEQEPQLELAELQELMDHQLPQPPEQPEDQQPQPPQLAAKELDTKAAAPPEPPLQEPASQAHQLELAMDHQLDTAKEQLALHTEVQAA